jgi:hypothetical protein
MAQDIFASNGPTTTVSSGGTTAPSAGTSESWTVASSTGFPAAATGVSQFRVADKAHPTELMIVTNVSGTTWTVTRGAESTTPVAHTAGFTIYQALTAGVLGGLTQRPAGTSATAAPLTYFNPKDDGAKFDGSTDDNAALNTTTARGNTIQFPPGTTVVNSAQLTFPSSNLHIRGSGMYDTTVKCTSSGLSSLWVHGSGFVSRVELSDMTLDGTGVSISAVAAFGNHLDRLRVRRCRFINWPSVIIQPGYAAEVIVEDCEADGAGSGLGTFFLATNRENESIIIRRNRLRWLNTGITIGSGNPTTTQYHSAYIDISDNYIDLGWWLLKAASSNSGGTVTYTSTTVTDSSAPFGATNSITAGTTIRALTSLQAGTLTTAGTQVTDSSGNFVTSNVWRGHILRSGTSFAVVSQVETTHQLHVEEWLDQTTYQPVTPPTSASYTIYGVALGAVVSNTSTAVTVAHGAGGNGGGWYDLQGNSVTPASGTLYEVLPAHPVYPIFCNVPTEKVKIHGNTVRRGWGDGIEFFGSRGIITGNIVEDGQDMGIVAEGYSATYPGVRNIIANNICRHNGTCGLNLIYQADCEVGPNQLEDNTWGDPSSVNIGQMQVNSCVNTTVAGGRATNSGESAINQAGLVITGSPTSGVKVIGFSGHGAALGDVYVASTVTAATCELLDISGTIAYAGTTNGQRTRVKGTGAPSLIASPGSLYLRTDGAAGTTLYVKESLSTSSGWNAFSSGGAGARAAYSSITTAVATASAAANTLTNQTAFPSPGTSSPQITLPNDANTYRVTLSAPYMTVSAQQFFAIGIGTAANAILKYCYSGVGGEFSAPCIIVTDVVGSSLSGSAINCYAYSSLGTGTVTMNAATNAPAELSAVRVV